MPKKTKYGNILQFAKEDTQVATFSGNIYRKQVAKFGQWVNPDYPWFWIIQEGQTILRRGKISYLWNLLLITNQFIVNFLICGWKAQVTGTQYSTNRLLISALAYVTKRLSSLPKYTQFNISLATKHVV